MIDKPIIFFSHSSRDEVMLRKLKSRLLEKVGGVVNIFLSSDGQSVPFGRNWVHEVEQALNEAKLMFVFLSPHALQSQWVLFESGFAYAKDVDVIPVGILGIDLGRITPPLGLLQGFNVNRGASLNNIIAKINAMAETTFPESFTDDDYADILSVAEQNQRSLFRNYSALIDQVRIPAHFFTDDTQSAIENELVAHGFESYRRDLDIISYGLEFYLFRTPPLPESDQPPNTDQTLLVMQEVTLNPDLSALTFPCVGALFRNLSDINVEIYFTEEVKNLHGLRLSSRIYGTEITLAGADEEFMYRDLTFSILPRTVPCLVCRCHGNSLDSAPLYDLIHRLFELGILYEY